MQHCESVSYSRCSSACEDDVVSRLMRSSSAAPYRGTQLHDVRNENNAALYVCRLSVTCSQTKLWLMWGGSAVPWSQTSRVMLAAWLIFFQLVWSVVDRWNLLMPFQVALQLHILHFLQSKIYALPTETEHPFATCWLCKWLTCDRKIKGSNVRRNGE